LETLQRYTWDIFIKNRGDLDKLLSEVSKLQEVTVLEVRDGVVDLHQWSATTKGTGSGYTL